MKRAQPRSLAALLGGLWLLSGAALADEAAIRKNLAARYADLPKIDEITKTPIPGLYELRMGTEVVYADEQGDHLIQGNILDTRNRVDLTRERIDKLTAIDFATLPLQDAIVYKQGTGARRMVVFADPNCPYCKHLEKDLLSVKDVTVYTFLYPILGADSQQKSRDIWCSKESGKVWRQWMIDGKAPPRSMGGCDTAALDRNTQLGTQHRITGTPAMVFEDGTRAPGVLPVDQIEKHLAATKAKGSGG